MLNQATQSDLLVDLSTEDQQLLTGGKRDRDIDFKKGYFYLFPKGEDFYYEGKAKKKEFDED
ncbi:MAG: hypothetical protein RMY62_025420 [Nostoc sp. ZfuVER08]|jgi:hypothetical protein|uniref:Uncharacterized protein n=1 Tax=Nostoc punctiforme FACHB-252 TaxID=1357509 RepID=A0ABR8HFX2_NOSPU|nr:hypothetical protein [Nostoc punctiforme]MBD2614700.1 hypothetical protein [Nostoc punctiforme FACHB-252]MBL1201376.1 hypothetical protein [Nostoc sp. GBBB01]MDZ8011128.1 hypothetical protein [Nostoc sp. ZfuVER08]